VGVSSVRGEGRWRGRTTVVGKETSGRRPCRTEPVIRPGGPVPEGPNPVRPQASRDSHKVAACARHGGHSARADRRAVPRRWRPRAVSPGRLSFHARAVRSRWRCAGSQVLPFWVPALRGDSNNQWLKLQVMPRKKILEWCGAGCRLRVGVPPPRGTASDGFREPQRGAQPGAQWAAAGRKAP
jgi:hypothetical protein